MHDLVIRSGSIIDGSGGPRQEGDIAIEGGRIVAVGERAGSARREIDAAGRLVTPGFVDVHTHYDGQATWDTLLEPDSSRGHVLGGFRLPASCDRWSEPIVRR